MSGARLPPLAWLRAFEAAGRLESFRDAGRELHVTPSAISHHVRSLERRLGRPLFQRTANRVRLTREGAAYLERLSAGFAQLAAAAEVLRPPEAAPRLTIGAFPFLVSEVLMPGLAALQARLPGVAISVVSGTHLALLTEADPARRVDAVVRYGAGRFPGCTARKLTDVTLLPVVAPRFVPADRAAAERLVSGGTRIAVTGPFEGWRVWSSAVGVSLSDSAEVLSFDSYPNAMRAAEQGLGVGLGLRPFIDSWLASGRLAPLLDLPAPVDQASYLVTAHYAAGRREIEVLAHWLTERLAGAG